MKKQKKRTRPHVVVRCPTYWWERLFRLCRLVRTHPPCRGECFQKTRPGASITTSERPRKVLGVVRPPIERCRFRQCRGVSWAGIVSRIEEHRERGREVSKEGRYNTNDTQTIDNSIFACHEESLSVHTHNNNNSITGLRATQAYNA